MPLTKRVVDCATGEAAEVELTADEVQLRAADEQQAAMRDRTEAAAAQDIAERRAAVVSELQAIRDAGTFAAAKPAILRVLVFILRRLGERASS